jgi:hypothetical protein
VRTLININLVVSKVNHRTDRVGVRTLVNINLVVSKVNHRTDWDGVRTLVNIIRIFIVSVLSSIGYWNFPKQVCILLDISTCGVDINPVVRSGT